MVGRDAWSYICKAEGTPHTTYCCGNGTRCAPSFPDFTDVTVSQRREMATSDAVSSIQLTAMVLAP